MALKEETASSSNANASERNGARKTRSPFNRKKTTTAKAAKPKAVKAKTAKSTSTVEKAEGAATAKRAPVKKVGAKARGKNQPAGIQPGWALFKGAKLSIGSEERQHLISQAAYLISCRRDPALGNPDSDWIHAEVVIDMLFDVRESAPDY